MCNKSWLRVVVAVCVCGLLVTGCRTKKPQPPPPPPEIGGKVTPEDVDQEINPPQTDRAYEGMRITDDPAAKIENVLFDYDSFQISPAEAAKIEKAAGFLKANAQVRLVAEGNCDERGSREYNLSLGEQRAGAVRAHLVGLGIAPERIETKSYGEEKPANLGHTEKAWSENRRVEFAFYR